MSLAWTYQGIPSSSFEIGGNTTLLRRPTASGDRDGIAPNLSGLRRYSPICVRQMHGIPPIQSEPTSTYISMYQVLTLVDCRNFVLCDCLYVYIWSTLPQTMKSLEVIIGQDGLLKLNIYHDLFFDSTDYLDYSILIWLRLHKKV